MLKARKKMTKEEKRACANKKMLFGVGIAIFGMLWMLYDVQTALIVMGLLIFLYGLVMRVSS